MFIVAFIGLIMRLRRRLYTEPWFLRLVLWMLPVGVIATIAGWVTSESGRQPWIVYGKLAVNQAASSLSTGELIASLAAFWIVYLVLVTAWIRQVVREVRRGPDPLPGQEGTQAAPPGTSDAPAPAGLPMTPVEA
jgi:cytochrome d ubiquinol oxidase subunit I